MNDAVIARMQADIEVLKHKVAQLQSPKDDEGELTDWAKSELAEALATPRSECVSHEEVKRMLDARK